GGEADDADALGVDAPLLGLAADQADGPLGVLQRPAGRLAPGVVGAARHAVFQDDAGDAERVQPGGDLLALELPEQVPVAATGADEDGRADVPVLRGAVDGQGRRADVGDQFRLLGDLDLLLVDLRRQAGRFGVDLVRLVGGRARPQADDLRLAVA